MNSAWRYSVICITPDGSPIVVTAKADLDYAVRLIDDRLNSPTAAGYRYVILDKETAKLLPYHTSMQKLTVVLDE